MLGAKRAPDVSLEDYMIYTNRAINALKARHGVVDLDLIALRNHFGWGGHILRKCEDNPASVLALVFTFRDRTWRSMIESQNGGNQLHRRKLRIWRWERPLYKFAAFHGHASWQELASCKRDWLARLDEMALWFRTHRA